MSFLSSLNIGGSALTAQRFRIDVISQNIANADVTKTEAGTPYARKRVIMRERGGNAEFSKLLKGGKGSDKVSLGVEIAAVEDDNADFKIVYDPEHPDADADGNVLYPNVDKLKEMMDLMSASQAYKANVNAINAIKTMAAAALQIGK